MNYTGLHEVPLNDEDMALFYQGGLKFDLKQNQYLLIKNEKNEIIDKYRQDSGKLVKIRPKTIDSPVTGKIRPRNDEQECYFDLLDNDNITVKTICGNWGSGKSFCAICWAVSCIEKAKYKKLIYIRNNIDVKDTNPLGALPSGLNDKLKPWAMPIADALGGEYLLDRYINEDKIELAHMGFIRGRSFENCIVMITESQNLTSDHIALLISRIGQNSVIIFDGDTRQTDKIVFEKDNGLNALVENLKGNELFGMVTLRKTERSKTAALAELIK